MRKRLVIGAFAAVVIGVAALVLSQPRKGTVEYHKQEYLRAHEPGFVGKRIMRGPSPIRDAYWAWQDRREDFHRQQLIRAGYLRRWEFTITNCSPLAFMSALHRQQTSYDIEWKERAFVHVFMTSNRLTIVARSNEMKVHEIVRRLDVAEP